MSVLREKGRKGEREGERGSDGYRGREGEGFRPTFAPLSPPKTFDEEKKVHVSEFFFPFFFFVLDVAVAVASRRRVRGEKKVGFPSFEKL